MYIIQLFIVINWRTNTTAALSFVIIETPTLYYVYDVH